jgi:hypothetical protein
MMDDRWVLTDDLTVIEPLTARERLLELLEGKVVRFHLQQLSKDKGIYRLESAYHLVVAERLYPVANHNWLYFYPNLDEMPGCPDLFADRSLYQLDWGNGLKYQSCKVRMHRPQIARTEFRASMEFLKNGNGQLCSDGIIPEFNHFLRYAIHGEAV